MNDIYKRYINPEADSKRLVWLSRLRAAAILLVGVYFGLVIDTISGVMQWITGALYGGYVVANVLKWSCGGLMGTVISGE